MNLLASIAKLLMWLGGLLQRQTGRHDADVEANEEQQKRIDAANAARADADSLVGLRDPAPNSRD